MRSANNAVCVTLDLRSEVIPSRDPARAAVMYMKVARKRSILDGSRARAPDRAEIASAAVSPWWAGARPYHCDDMKTTLRSARALAHIRPAAPRGRT